VAVIVPAYNEEMVILETIASLLASNHGEKFEIIVIDDGSTDNTYKIANEIYGKHPNIRVFRVKNG
jgi:glycosyltransferase involved in cell wall biosynthesis